MGRGEGDRPSPVGQARVTRLRGFAVLPRPVNSPQSPPPRRGLVFYPSRRCGTIAASYGERRSGYDGVGPDYRAGRTLAKAGRLRRGCRRPQGGPRGDARRSLGVELALVAATLADQALSPIVIVCPRADDADDFADDFQFFSPLVPERFPARGSAPGDRVIYDEIFGDRVRLLKLLGSSRPPGLVLASIQSLIQPVPEPALLESQTRTLEVGEEIEIQALARWLVENGFHNTTAVELPGEFSLRGGIVDIFAPDWYDPVRVGVLRRRDRIDPPVRGCQPAQPGDAGRDRRDGAGAHGRRPRTLGRLPAAGKLVPAGRAGGAAKKRAGTISSGSSSRRTFHSVPSVLERGATASLRSRLRHRGRLAGNDLPAEDRVGRAVQRRHRQGPRRAGRGRRGPGGVRRLPDRGRSPAAGRHLRPARGWPATASCTFPSARCKAAFGWCPSGSCCSAAASCSTATDLRRPARRRLGRVIDSFLELREGDLVVHLAHGIGRYRGLKLLEKDGQVEEHLELEFHGEHEALRARPRRSSWCRSTSAGRRAGRRWPSSAAGSGTGRSRRVEEAVTDLAADMLELQAARASRPGISFPADTEWQQEFDASFPYQRNARPVDRPSTRSSATCSQPRPMDRLLCGDVGYGKTEVAMRAAFKAVDAGYQVAVLVPTTVLAEQHLRTFHRAHGRVSLRDRRPRRVSPRGGQQTEIIQPAWPTARSTSSSARTGWRSPTCSSTTWAW